MGLEPEYLVLLLCHSLGPAVQLVPVFGEKWLDAVTLPGQLAPLVDQTAGRLGFGHYSRTAGGQARLPQIGCGGGPAVGVGVGAGQVPGHAEDGLDERGVGLAVRLRRVAQVLGQHSQLAEPLPEPLLHYSFVLILYYKYHMNWPRPHRPWLRLIFCAGLPPGTNCTGM